jgi:predicted anti-sigma-YlaC factor YlaD
MRLARGLVVGFAALIFASCMSSPSFVGAVLPGQLERNEKKLTRNPLDTALLLETGRYYISYANAFVQTPAEMLPPEDFGQKMSEKARAKGLYLRGVELLERAVDVDDDVDFLYWKSAGYLAAYSLDPFDFNSGLSAKLPVSLDMLTRARALDPDYEEGTLDELAFLIYASLPVEMGGDKARAKQFFEAALEKSRGLRPGLFVSWAQVLSVYAQDYGEFKAMLDRALAINPREDKKNVLINKINQTKAQYLLDNAQYFFVEVE